MNCPACNSTTLDIVVVLGKAALVRCRCCNAEFTADADELEPQFCPTCGQ